MYGPTQPLISNNIPWNYHRPPHYPQWRPNLGPRAPFHERHQHFKQCRPPGQWRNEDYWCETCDRGFGSEDLLNQHKQQHQKCNIDGCQFIAHPKVITKHIQMQHSSGLYKKIANLNKPDEIEKWREERRKKYPTKSNIDRKAAELKEKIDRGEKMGLERNNKKHNKEFKPGHETKRKNSMSHENQPRSRFKRNYTNDHNKKPPQKPTPKLPPVEDSRKLKPFTGILNLEMDSESETEDVTVVNYEIEDDDYELLSNEKKSFMIAEPVICEALSTLMCEYDSSDQEDSNIVIAVTKPPNNFNPGQNKPSRFEHGDVSKNSYVTQKENQVADIITPNEVLDRANQTAKDEKRKLNIENVVNLNAKLNDPFVDDNDGLKKIKVIENASTETNCDSFKKINGTELEKSELYNPLPEENDSGPDEVHIQKSEDTTKFNNSQSGTSKTTIIVRKKALSNRRQIFKRQKPKLPSTLLQKLLSKEMQQERNIVLQCIRYIKRNNYFDNKE